MNTPQPPAAASPPAEHPDPTHRQRPAARAHGPEHWVRCLLEQDTSALNQLPAGLRRALLYMAAHYGVPISAGQLADHAHVSVSHLRFLFRDRLGISFKLFLQRLRIAHAERLLLASPPQRVTAVALSVGFNDLSHFEKCFRQIVGLAPGQLRRARP